MADAQRAPAVSVALIAEVAERLRNLGALSAVRFEPDGAVIMLTEPRREGLAGADSVEDELAAWRLKRDGAGGSGRRP